MSNIKYFLFIIFIVFNANSVNANALSTTRSQQNNADICGEKTCEFIFKEMRKFAKNGSSMAQATLFMMYADGIGTEMDQDLSIKYIKKAATSGLPFAEYMLGMLYRKDQIVGKYGKDADYWLRRAATNNYKPAIDLLLSESKILPETIINQPKAVFASMTDEDMEVIVVNADNYTLTDFYDLLQSQGHGKVRQIGSRIKGRGCSYNSCSYVDINTPMGALQFILFTLKANR